MNGRLGAGNFALVLTADHGVAPLPDYASGLRLPAHNVNARDYGPQLNRLLSAKLGKTANYVVGFNYPRAFLSEPAFAGVNLGEAEAERLAGETMKQLGIPAFATKAQLAAGDAPNSVFAEQLRNSYSPLPGWYVYGLQPPFVVGSASGTEHGSTFAYDAHVPLVFYGSAFRPGVYDQAAEPIDVAVTFSELLGINQPASATGHVLWQALAAPPPERR